MTDAPGTSSKTFWKTPGSVSLCCDSTLRGLWPQSGRSLGESSRTRAQLGFLACGPHWQSRALSFMLPPLHPTLGPQRHCRLWVSGTPDTDVALLGMGNQAPDGQGRVPSPSCLLQGSHLPLWGFPRVLALVHRSRHCKGSVIERVFSEWVTASRWPCWPTPWARGLSQRWVLWKRSQRPSHRVGSGTKRKASPRPCNRLFCLKQ